MPQDFQAQSLHPDFVRKALIAKKLRQRHERGAGWDLPIARKVSLAPMLTIMLIESNIRTVRATLRAGEILPEAAQRRGDVSEADAK